MGKKSLLSLLLIDSVPTNKLCSIYVYTNHYHTIPRCMLDVMDDVMDDVCNAIHVLPVCLLQGPGTCSQFAEKNCIAAGGRL
jgi:hypothetical protein